MLCFKWLSIFLKIVCRSLLELNFIYKVRKFSLSDESGGINTIQMFRRLKNVYSSDQIYSVFFKKKLKYQEVKSSTLVAR